MPGPEPDAGAGWPAPEARSRKFEVGGELVETTEAPQHRAFTVVERAEFLEDRTVEVATNFEKVERGAALGRLVAGGSKASGPVGTKGGVGLGDIEHRRLGGLDQLAAGVATG